MKTTLLTLLALASVLPARAAFHEAQDNAEIPVPVTTGGGILYQGLSSKIKVDNETGPILNLRVGLEISGMPTGNLYAYLSHGDDLVVLLNRIGRTDSNKDGFSDIGFDMTFEQNKRDVHLYGSTGSPLMGTWGVDAREKSPFDVVNTNPQGKLLTSFHDPNGEWILFVENFGATGGVGAKLKSWSLEINYTVVPEPGTWMSGSACILVFWLSFFKGKVNSSLF